MSSRIALFACLVVLTFALSGCNRSWHDAQKTEADAAELPGEFFRLMNAGKNYLDQSDATNALAVYMKAQALVPNHPDVHLNLANALLLAGSAADAIREADEVLTLEPNSAAAWFVKGSAYLRLSKPAEAVKALENVQRIDPGETAAFFQLGRARMELQQWEAAITAFKDGLARDPNHLHTAAHYMLGQALTRAGRQDEAQQELRQYEAGAGGGRSATTVATFEKSKYTQARVPFKLEQPDKEGVEVTFVDATKEMFPEGSKAYGGPAAVLDVSHSGWNSLFVMEQGKGFRLLLNTNGVFHSSGTNFPAASNRYEAMLVGDLQNDRAEDVVVLGEQGTRVFQVDNHGAFTDASEVSRVAGLQARDGLLMDLDFTGKLDLIAITASNRVEVYRQSGALLFTNVTSSSGIAPEVAGAQSVFMEDWNSDGQMDLIASRKGVAPLLLEKQRGGPLVPRELTNCASGTVFCTGDFDNDLRPDLAIATGSTISIRFNSGARKDIKLSGHPQIRQLKAVDYDNDGWLDLWAAGDRIHVWRNAGLAGFQERQLGLDTLQLSAVSELHFADFDRDCDSDVVVVLANGGLSFLRNNGANANGQAKVHLFGNRSNASGLGCRIEIETGGLRLSRTVQQLPIEIGVGKHQQLDSFLVHWLNWPQGGVDVPFNCKEPLLAFELTLQEGSCPYLYAWDGKHFRFVTDVLGAAPLGLPVAEGHYSDSDPEEYVWLGGEHGFPARNGYYEVRITEELREVLYLDEAKLVVVDREPGVEVHPTNKLLPRGPFPKGSLLTLHNEAPLRRAETLDGVDVTEQLRSVDKRRASPPKLRIPQLRGLAEPHGLILDFGALDPAKPLVLVMNGWIRFGGGMANIAASQDPSLPFPFPTLDAEVSTGRWEPLDITVGAPAGKTKTILVDLEGKVSPGTRRLRLKQAFEIHWDRIAMMEKQRDPETRLTFVAPSRANLHFRGFSPLEKLPSDCPLTPNYDVVDPNCFWTIIPGGWCTRYGDVSELVATRDEGLALINAGDELSLSFAAASLPAKPSGTQREFFLYLDGWDKDSDFHVAEGTRVEPLPFHGMDDQLYGRQDRPAFKSDALHLKYNTRWVEGKVLKQVVRSRFTESQN